MLEERDLVPFQLGVPRQLRFHGAHVSTPRLYVNGAEQPLVPLHELTVFLRVAPVAVELARGEVGGGAAAGQVVAHGDGETRGVVLRHVVRGGLGEDTQQLRSERGHWDGR